MWKLRLDRPYLRVLLYMVPFVLAYAGYEMARGIAFRLQSYAVYAPYVDLEVALFGVPLAVYFQFHRLLVLDIYTGIVYALHPVYFFAFAVLLAFREPKLFRRLLAAFLVASAVAITVYVLSPTAPPWIALPCIERPPNLVLKLVELVMGARIDPNPYAAMPSMHVGMAVIFGYYYVKLYGGSRRSLLVAVAWVASMSFATVYTANHYVADVAAGLALGYAASLLGDKLGGLSLH
ncbi:phosphatase PAP2 family protein [Hyperthermus butylicus]|uniref:Inositolphosphotransferase Aur1/Ipt1 domain-containing protein n=1 Tax=Hyperthermus butylicus (strain DSM 5456 / JCM 9403 / PLM1-5) TaxID=415426 RepID=A2BL06_HYPBU|nr:phosphatase PAP2 family protein [Hyperthermus butylicus]ABM80667.1 hypothetical protein Hbut_0814 [Hyperthermus butylicus DSM 5456]